jgi:phage-related tail protein
MDLGTEEYQALEYAATKAGFPLDYFRHALEELNEKAVESDRILGEWIGRMDELSLASDETKEAVAEQMNYWNDLGVSLYDNEGKLKTTHDLMYDVIDALGQMESKTQRDEAAMDLFGKKFAVVNPLIKTGSAQLREFEEEAYRTGVVLDEQTVEKLNQTGAAFDTFQMRVSAAWRKLAANLSAVDLIPGLNQLSFLEKGWDFLKTIFGGGKGYASGTNYAPGGMALVGERGPEIVELPRGSKVYPNGTAPGIGGATVNESNVYNITIDASSVEEFNDIVRIAQTARVGMRRG